MEKQKKTLFVVGMIWFLWVSTFFLIDIDLLGDTKIRMKLGDNYEECGAVASFLGVHLNVTTSNDIDTSKVGIYSVTYKARNFFGIVKSKTRIVEIYDATKPSIKLKGKLLETVPLDSNYTEIGYYAVDDIDGDLTDKVVVENNVDTKNEGLYEVIYRVKDSSGNETIVKRLVRVQGKILTYQDKYNKTSNVKNSWWTDNKFDHKRPTGGDNLEKLKQYSAYFLGEDNKTIYLTFDEGSDDTYLDLIADVLTKNNVSATFFLCGHFMENHKEQVKKWVENGHSIGNHTFHHRETTNYTNEEGFSEFQNEITSMEELYQEITGSQMDRLYRSPRGEWSYRELQMVQDMGYRSYFWSADYLDYDKEYTKEYVLEQLMKRYHDGAIYMLHPKQKGTYLALEEFIKKMRTLGYQFGLVKDIYY